MSKNCVNSLFVASDRTGILLLFKPYARNSWTFGICEVAFFLS